MSTSAANPTYTTLAHKTALLTTGLLLGSTSWASLAVMPSIIAAPLSTNAKLSVFSGLIHRANAVLPPLFLIATGALSYLSYTAPLYSTPTGVAGMYGVGGSRWGSVLGLGRRGVFGAGVLGMVACVVIQGFVKGKNAAMVEIVEKGEAKEDDGREGNERIGELWRWNLGRVVGLVVAFGVSVLEA